MNLLKDKDKGFSVIELAIVIAVLSIFSAVAIPAFNCVRKRAISTAAQETIRQIKEECETNYIYGIDKFTSSNPDKYQISSSGSNSCSEGTVSLTPEDTNLYATYFYKFADSELSYNFKGQTGTSFVACNKLICGVGDNSNIGVSNNSSNNMIVASSNSDSIECKNFTAISTAPFYIGPSTPRPDKRGNMYFAFNKPGCRYEHVTTVHFDTIYILVNI